MEREIAGFSLPFAAGVLVTAYIGADFCSIQTSLHFYILSLIFICVLSLLELSRGDCQKCVILILTGIAAFACGALSSMTAASLHQMPQSDLETMFRGLSTYTQRRIDAIPFESDRTAALIKALLTGEKSSLPSQLKSAFRDSGASHILALSGLHLGIIYAILSKLLSFLGNSVWMRRLRSVIIVCICGIYTSATGAGDSLVRSLIFITLREAAVATCRYHGLGQILLASLVIQLVIDPLAIRSVGFQLSYASMAGIAFIHPWMKGLWERSGLDRGTATRPLKWVWNTLALSIACQVATAPLAYHYFETFPKYFMLTNLLTLPLSGLLIPSALLTLTLTILGCCPQIMVQATELIVNVLIWTLETISRM